MYKNIATQRLADTALERKQLEVDVLRLDQLHPHVSGNKWFKLKYHLQEAQRQRKAGMMSFGGAFSNHLVALAFACREQGLKSTAIVRGQEPPVYGPSLQQMKADQMQLIFVSREAYRDHDSLAASFVQQHPEYYVVPAGGGGPLGIRGAAEILDHPHRHYSHIVCAVGTGTTLSGLIRASQPGQQVTGIVCLKWPAQDRPRLFDDFRKGGGPPHVDLVFDYHFGGYAKHSPELLSFMNTLYMRHQLPSDFVYTAKMFYAVFDLAHRDYFPSGSRILAIHSGGLQGNRSLAPGLLCF